MIVLLKPPGMIHPCGGRVGSREPLSMYPSLCHLPSTTRGAFPVDPQDVEFELLPLRSQLLGLSW